MLYTSFGSFRKFIAGFLSLCLLGIILLPKITLSFFSFFFFVFQNIFVPQKYTLPEALEIYVLCRGVFPVADVFSKVFDELFCRTPQDNCFCDSNNVDNTQTECFKTSVLY